MARHLEQVHADELEVAKVLNLTAKTKERSAAWAALVNKDGFNHYYSKTENVYGCNIPRFRARPTNRQKRVIVYLVNTAGLCMSKQTCGNTRRKCP